MNRYTSNVALIALVAAEMGLKPDTYRHEAASQVGKANLPMPCVYVRVDVWHGRARS